MTLPGRFEEQHARSLSTQTTGNQVPLNRVANEQAAAERQIAAQQLANCQRQRQQHPPPATTSPSIRQLSSQFARAKHSSSGPSGHVNHHHRHTKPYNQPLTLGTQQLQTQLPRRVRKKVKTAEKETLSDVLEDLSDIMMEFVSLVVYTSSPGPTQHKLVERYLTPERTINLTHTLNIWEDTWMEDWNPVHAGDTQSCRNTHAIRQVTELMREAASKNSRLTALEPPDEGSGKFCEGETRARQIKPAPKVSDIF